MPTLPLIFDTILGLGATGPHATFPHPFLHLRERSETLALVVTFSPFLAGESRRPAKIACVVLHRFHDVSPTEQSKAKEYKNNNNNNFEERARDHISNGGRSLWAGNEIPARTGCGQVGRLIIVSTWPLGRARAGAPDAPVA